MGAKTKAELLDALIVARAALNQERNSRIGLIAEVDEERAIAKKAEAENAALRERVAALQAEALAGEQAEAKRAAMQDALREKLAVALSKLDAPSRSACGTIARTADDGERRGNIHGKKLGVE